MLKYRLAMVRADGRNATELANKIGLAGVKR
jgi:hypothetical protein